MGVKMSSAQELIDEVTIDEKELADINMSKILKNLNESGNKLEL